MVRPGPAVLLLSVATDSWWTKAGRMYSSYCLSSLGAGKERTAVRRRDTRFAEGWLLGNGLPSTRRVY